MPWQNLSGPKTTSELASLPLDTSRSPYPNDCAFEPNKIEMAYAGTSVACQFTNFHIHSSAVMVQSTLKRNKFLLPRLAQCFDASRHESLPDLAPSSQTVQVSAPCRFLEPRRPNYSHIIVALVKLYGRKVYCLVALILSGDAAQVNVII